MTRTVSIYGRNYQEALAEFISTATEPTTGQTSAARMTSAFAEWCLRTGRPFDVNPTMTGQAARALGTVTIRRTAKGTMWVGIRPRAGNDEPTEQ